VVQEFSSSIQVEVSEILPTIRWSEPAERFLAAHSTFDLGSVVASHRQGTEGLVVWFLNSLASESAPLVDSYNELRVARNAILAGVDINSARRLTEAATMRRESTESPEPSNIFGKVESEMVRDDSSRRIANGLLQVLDVEAAKGWLHARNAKLAGKKPWDLILAGNVDPVLSEVARLSKTE
jgi:hypothetical protein